MKRLRDDVCDNSPLFKRPFGSSLGESHDQSLVHGKSGLGGTGGGGDGAGASKPIMTYNDAFSYLKKVKDTFPDNKGKYDMFLNIMIDFKARRIDTVDVMVRVRELFKGHPSLLLGLNPFLPSGYEIISTNKEKKPVDFEQALSLVNKIKERLGNGHLYESFLDIFRKYKNEGKDINEVCHEVIVLLNDHPDLLAEFTRFLPSPSTANLLSNLKDAKTLMK